MIPQLNTVTLMITGECNLACSYCYVSRDRGAPMSAQTVQRALTLLSERAGNSVSVALFGGEPLLTPDTVEQVLSKCRRGLGQRRVRFQIPTNLMHPVEALARWAREPDVELWPSVDPIGTDPERRFPNGVDASEQIRRRLRILIENCGPAHLTVRSTATPSNVTGLSRLLADLAELGVARWIVVPALELQWNDNSVAAWGEQHRRIGLWLRGRTGAGHATPWISSIHGIAERLTQLSPRPTCGAGVSRCAMDRDGSLHACHRFISLSGRGQFALGTPEQPHLANWRRFRDLSLATVRDAMSCADCPARLGCVQFCPAIGVELLGQPELVPDVACRLMREQVRAVSETLGFQPEKRRSPRLGALATVLLGTAAAAACGGRMDDESGSGGADSIGETGGTATLTIHPSGGQSGSGSAAGQSSGGAEANGGQAAGNIGGAGGGTGANTGGTYWDNGCIG